jgi:cation diffusion facilitator family transporter
MSAPEAGTKHIIQSLLVNVAIAIVKAIAAVLTKSGAMLAEALHSFSDCGNQVLLLVGVRQAQRPADASHPLGYGRALYFWSFLVALMLFVGGGVFSIYEGIHKIREPEAVEKPLVGLLVLLVSLGLEGSATFSNIKEIDKRRGAVPFIEFLRASKDVDLIVVFGENAAAVLGLVFALFALTLSWITGNGIWDGIGSTLVGLVLVGVAMFLALEVQSLLLGESADFEVEAAVRTAVGKVPEISSILNLRTVQQGAGEVLVAVKVSFVAGLTAEDVCHKINRFEELLRAARPEVRWCFVEPDLPKDAPSEAEGHARRPDGAESVGTAQLPNS